MARIVPQAAGVELTPFEEPSFAVEEPGEGAAAHAAPPELLTPDAVRRRADAHAAATVAAAHAEADQIRSVAEAEGRAAGETAGKAQALEEHRAAAGTLTALADAIRDETQQSLPELERYVTDVALAIVRRLLGDLAEAQPDVMAHVVGQALRALGHRDVVTVRVHPTMVQVVQRERDALLRVYEDARELHILEDDTVEPGGCILDTARAVIDATVAGVLDTLHTNLHAAASETPPPAPDPET